VCALCARSHRRQIAEAQLTIGAHAVLRAAADAATHLIAVIDAVGKRARRMWACAASVQCAHGAVLRVATEPLPAPVKRRDSDDWVEVYTKLENTGVRVSSDNDHRRHRRTLPAALAASMTPPLSTSVGISGGGSHVARRSESSGSAARRERPTGDASAKRDRSTGAADSTTSPRK
jgi:hypothetical protein